MTRHSKIISALLVVLTVAVTVTACNRPEPVTPLRVGWQPPWANQGQVVAVLKHTDVLQRNGGASVEYRPFTYGGPMTEAALAGQLDLLLVGNQPAITLLSRDENWRLIARLTGYRSAIVIPSGSALATIGDLKGKTLATAFGSTTHRDTVTRLREAGLEVGRDITLVSLDQAEHATVIAQGGATKWGPVDAIATYDPTVAVGVNSGNARVLLEWASPAVVVGHRRVLDERLADLQSFLKAYAESYYLYAVTPDRFDSLYQVDSRLPLPADVYKKMASFEPNLKATSLAAVDVNLNDQIIAQYQRDVETAFSLGLIKTRIDIRRFVDLRGLPSR